MKTKLIPRQVTITSELKFFGLDRGSSTGSPVSVTYDVPEGLEGSDFRRTVLEEKERLDILVLTMELARGGITRLAYDEKRANLRRSFDGLLQRESSDKQSESGRGKGESGSTGEAS